MTGLIGKPLDPSELKLAEFSYNRWHAIIDEGISLQEVLAPEAWKKHANGTVRPSDIIRVVAKDDAYDVDLVVRAVLPGAGLLLKVYGMEGVPNHPVRKMLDAAMAEARAEEQAEREAALNGGAA